MNKQTESFLNALKDIEEGKIVDLDKALTEEPPSEELQKVFRDIEKLDAEREAWKRMFDLQSKLVMNLEMEKVKLEKEIENLKNENRTLQEYLNNIHNNLKQMAGEK